MALKLMISRGLYCSPKFVSIDVEPLPRGRSDDFNFRPGFDFEVNENDPVGIEKEKNLVQPTDDLCGLVRSRCFEVTFLNGLKAGRVSKNGDEALRCCDEAFFTCGTPSKDANIRGVLE